MSNVQVIAQQQNIWVWGDKAGLDFNTSPPTAFHFNNTFPSLSFVDYALEASSSVSDDNGQLLFHSEGSYVFDNQQNIMPNGSNLTGITLTSQTPSPTSSAAQGCLILPVPGSNTKYYIFSLTSVETGNMGRLYYSVVDMNLNNGLGDVITSQKGILIDSGHTEQMAAVAYCGDYWLITIDRIGGQIKSYKIGSTSISQAVLSPLLPNTASNIGAGSMCVASNGKKIAILSGGVNGLHLFDFDGVSGLLSNQQIIDQSLSFSNLGLSFSPDNTKMYISSGDNNIYQYDLNAGTTNAITNSKTTIFSGTGIFHGQMKLAPNGKIYFSGHPGNVSAGISTLSSINNPNAAGLACQPQLNSIQLASNSYHRLGFPTAIPKYQSGLGNITYGAVNACRGDTSAYAWINQPSTDTSTYSITWMDAAYNVLQFVAATNNGDTLKNLHPGLYIADIENNDGCKLRIGITIDSPTYKAYFETDNIVCVNTPLQFNPDFINNDFDTWQWDLGNGQTSNLQFPQVQYANAGSYTIQLIGTTAMGCKDTFEQTVIVDSIMRPEFELNRNEICVGESIDITAFYGNNVKTAKWNFGDGGSLSVLDSAFSYAYPQAGSFDIEMNVNYRACPDVGFSRNIIVHDYPKVDLGSDTGLCYQGNPIELKNLEANQQGDRFKWNSGALTESIYATHHGIFSLTVTRNDCSSTDSIDIKKDCYIDIPNAFIPGSGVPNGYFFPRSILSKGVTQFSMTIYNRWGQVIFQTNNPDGSGWDGNYNSQPQPKGVYVYQIDVTYRDGKSEKYQGNVTLMR